LKKCYFCIKSFLFPGDYLQDNSPERTPKTRRESRAKRVNAMKQWQDGRYLDEHTGKERWSREAKKPRRKVQKKSSQVFKSGARKQGVVLMVHRRSCIVSLNWEHSKAFHEISDGDIHSLGPEGEVILQDYVSCRYSTVLESGENAGRPAVGDNVLVAEEEDSGELFVLEVLPRKSALTRPGPDDRIHKQLVLAANIDQIVVVGSVAQPDFNPGFLDRVLLAARINNIDLYLVLNKMDLLGDEAPESVLDFDGLVKDMLPLSAASGEGLENLEEILKGKRSVFTGQSGVGKSSLVRKLIPGMGLRVGEVRQKDGRGRHTTTSSSLFKLPFGGEVIDTPGIRGLGVLNLPPAELAEIFPEFQRVESNCRFRNCLHLKEPGCAVLQALEEERISARAYGSYLRILEDSKNSAK
jgi:ribosome biogenesis GTPase